MNIVLIGYRGTGKSSVGRSLGRLLGLPAVSLDVEIVREAGRSVPEIVSERGWTGFRDLESSLCRRYAAQDGTVIDCGGGIIERDENVRVLRERGFVIWLQASVTTIVRRIGGDDQRPSLTGAKSFLDEIAEVLERRTPLYRSAADAIICTDDKPLVMVTAEAEHLSRSALAGFPLNTQVEQSEGDS